jgi:hypothetical protein
LLLKKAEKSKKPQIFIKTNNDYPKGEDMQGMEYYSSCAVK